VAEQTMTVGEALDFNRRFAEPLDARLRERAQGWGLPTDALRNSVVGQVVERIRQVFDTPLHSVLAAAWRRHPACRAFCDPARHPPGEAHTLELAEHALGWECKPAVEVLAEGLAAAGAGRLAELEFRVDLEVEVKAGVLTIQDARFMRMDAAELTLAGTLLLEEFTIARYQVPLRFPGTVRFGEAGEPICETAPAQVVAVPRIVDAAQV
jgi:hypothetical protein